MNQLPFQLDTARGVFRVMVEGDAHAPTLLLSNSLGTTLEMWDPQINALTKQFRVVRYDTRGHGGSDITPGPYSFEQLGLDALAVLDALQIEKASFCGVSMGGHTGLWLGIHAAERFEAIVVSNSAAKIGTEKGWEERAALLRQGGQQSMQELAQTAPERWFTPQYIQHHAATVQEAQAQLAQQKAEGYAACCDALAQSDLRTDLHRIAIPTLFIAGLFDPVTTVEDAKNMQAAVIGSELVVLDASHLSNIEVPQAFTDGLVYFLNSVLNLA
ncbi:3-oxoadipate enol-lactonase [Paenalcaligenes hominis]|uniref:3-oxoadipate enol-lactonase n=1 Tax=Paenalcaligenes hominis TaxID=643674 RepID=UPI003523820B